MYANRSPGARHHRAMQYAGVQYTLRILKEQVPALVVQMCSPWPSQAKEPEEETGQRSPLGKGPGGTRNGSDTGNPPGSSYSREELEAAQAGMASPPVFRGFVPRKGVPVTAMTATRKQARLLEVPSRILVRALQGGTAAGRRILRKVRTHTMPHSLACCDSVAIHIVVGGARRWHPILSPRAGT
eukprot:gene14467-biopygen4903